MHALGKPQLQSSKEVAREKPCYTIKGRGMEGSRLGRHEEPHLGSGAQSGSQGWVVMATCDLSVPFLYPREGVNQGWANALHGVFCPRSSNSLNHLIPTVIMIFFSLAHVRALMRI